MSSTSVGRCGGYHRAGFLFKNRRLIRAVLAQRGTAIRSCLGSFDKQITVTPWSGSPLRGPTSPQALAVLIRRGLKVRHGDGYVGLGETDHHSFSPQITFGSGYGLLKRKKQCVTLTPY